MRDPAHHDVHLAGMAMPRARHVCAFFNSRDEEDRVLLPFALEGFERGEKALHIVDPDWRAERLRRLQGAGVDAVSALRSGQLEVRRWDEAYLRGGHFDQDAMLALIEEVLTDGASRGFPLTRLWANMEWALEDRRGVGDLVEYETRLNYVLPRYQDPVICTYDLAKFDADVVMDVMRTHPMVLIGEVLAENPFFSPPDQFLAELRGRPGPASAT
jgi:hypothetical protein